MSPIAPSCPCTMTSMTSVHVGPAMFTVRHMRLSILRRTVSTAVRVFPDPRPIRMSQMNQSPSGSRCAGLAPPCRSGRCQSWKYRFTSVLCSRLKEFSTDSLLFSGNEISESIVEGNSSKGEIKATCDFMQ